MEPSSSVQSFLDPQLPSYRLALTADEVFARVNPYPGTGFRNHCHRLFRFVDLLLKHEDVFLDPNMAYAIAMFHDLGLVCENVPGDCYPQRSLAFFEQETRDCDWGDTPYEIVAECFLYNHLLLSTKVLTPQADMFRRAVKVEHSHGWIRFGLPKQEVKTVFQSYPQANFLRVLTDFTWRVFRREPVTLVNGIFFSA